MMENGPVAMGLPMLLERLRPVVGQSFQTLLRAGEHERHFHKLLTASRYKAIEIDMAGDRRDLPLPAARRWDGASVEREGRRLVRCCLLRLGSSYRRLPISCGAGYLAKEDVHPGSSRSAPIHFVSGGKIGRKTRVSSEKSKSLAR